MSVINHKLLLISISCEEASHLFPIELYAQLYLYIMDISFGLIINLKHTLLLYYLRSWFLLYQVKRIYIPLPDESVRKLLLKNKLRGQAFALPSKQRSFLDTLYAVCSWYRYCVYILLIYSSEYPGSIVAGLYLCLFQCCAKLVYLLLLAKQDKSEESDVQKILLLETLYFLLYAFNFLHKFKINNILSYYYITHDAFFLIKCF